MTYLLDLKQRPVPHIQDRAPGIGRDIRENPLIGTMNTGKIALSIRPARSAIAAAAEATAHEETEGK